jgi:hypothetical protein
LEYFRVNNEEGQFWYLTEFAVTQASPLVRNLEQECRFRFASAPLVLTFFPFDPTSDEVSYVYL